MIRIMNRLFFAFLFVLPVHSTAQTPADSINIDGKIFEKVEFEATYPGGTEAWLNFLTSTINAGVATDNGAPIGRYTVIAQFIVMKDGTISDIKTLTKFGYGMEQEVIRTLKLSGLWNPAIQNQRPVKAYRKQPVTFQVEDDDINFTTKEPFVLYTKTENSFVLSVKKVKPDDLSLTISQGSIIPKGDGQYIVKVNKPGRAIITITGGKKNKEIGMISFEVREKE